MKQILLLLTVLACADAARSQPDSLVDVFPLAIGNQWRHHYTTYKREPPMDAIFTDSGWVQHTVSGKQQLTDSTIWSLTRIRNFTYCQRAIPPIPGWDTCYIVIDTSTIQLIEQYAGAHRMYAPAFTWKDIFPFAATLTDTTGMYRYRRVDSSGIATIRMSEPDQFCAHSFLTTLQRGIGVTAIQCTLLRCTDFHNTNHTLLNYLVLSSPEPDNRATTYALYQNYPNPFNPSTSIRFLIADYPEGASGFVTLKIYDLLGREVARLVDEVMAPGDHSIIFDATGLSSGVYFYRLNVGSFSATKKLIYLQ